ncbi:MAG: hypothetical protein ACRDZ8_21985 [Acidimicrobiales bacterium]
MEAVAAGHRKVARCRGRSRPPPVHGAGRRVGDLFVHEDLGIADLVSWPAACPDGQGVFEPNGAIT